MSVQEITVAAGGNNDNVKKLLAALHKTGDVERVPTGWYQLPNPQGEMPF